MYYLKKTLVFLLLVCLSVNLSATHNRAGEITYKHISGYTFEITITTYTYEPSKANRLDLTAIWGDGTSSIVNRTSYISLPNQYLHNTYVARHTFPGPGVYQILMEDPNRNLGVKNIPNSVNTVFSIKTTMLIGPFTGNNSTPILLNPPIDKAAKGHIFIHNPTAFDPDGDSISYELTKCTSENGEAIKNYVFPRATDSLYIDSYRGDLVWNTPVDTGVYNIAIYVDEWRNGVRVGRIARDMQIDVYDTDNNPPVNDPIPDICVEAGDTINLLLRSTDIDNDPVSQTLISAPTQDNSASFELIEAGQGISLSRFIWPTNCDDARQQPYTLVLKSQDQVSNDISLVDITSFYIKILHSSPKNLKLLPGTDSIRLEWDVSNCGNPAGYKIYRKINPSGFIPDSCEYGVPEYTGYVLLDKVKGKYTNYFTDDNNELGLVPGFDYCYMITAYYSDNAESFASEEHCATLIPGVPAILQVSVEEDDATNGSIFLSWAVPPDIDTIDDGPYRYDIYRMSPKSETYTLAGSVESLDLSDTTFTDSGINTLIFPYHYTVKLLYYEGNEWFELPNSESASSLYLELLGSDNTVLLNIKKRTPWLNYEHHIFRKREEMTNFDSLGLTTSTTYIDTGLENNIYFTYKTRALGSRPLYGREYFTQNLSHINTASAIDTIPPCAPSPQVISFCDSAYNQLSWLSPKYVCGDEEVVYYKIYYSPTLEDELKLIHTQNAPDTVFIHSINLESMAAVYGVTAVDSFNNESAKAKVTIDSCIMYRLPNVFSPNNDGINDIYVSFNLGGFVKRVDMQIFNRYGQPIYSTNDPDINWDGRSEISKKIVPTGVYYYVCRVFEPRLTGEIEQNLRGFIHVFSESDQSNSKE